jgi:hypothetical protein
MSPEKTFGLILLGFKRAIIQEEQLPEKSQH